MTKKVKVSFMIVVWSIVAIQMFVNYRQSTGETVTAFSVVDDSISEDIIKGYGYFETMELGDVSRKKMLEELAEKLGITDGYTFSSGEGDGFRKTILTKDGRYAKTVLQIVSLYDTSVENSVPEQYIAVEITASAGSKQAVKLYHKVKKLYEEMGLKNQVSLEIDAGRRGNYVDSKGKGIFEDIFKAVKARRVDSIMENGICTVYGYTRSEEDYLTLNGKKVNMQIVLTYDEEKDTTYIKIGMPIVNSAY